MSPQGEPTSNDLVMFKRSNAKEIAAAVLYLQRQQRLGKPQFPPNARDGMVWNHKVKVIATIAAASAISTPRSGTGYLCVLVSGVWTPTSDVITIYNPSTAGSADINTFVTVSWVEGIWEITMDPNC